MKNEWKVSSKISYVIFLTYNKLKQSRNEQFINSVPNEVNYAEAGEKTVRFKERYLK